MRLFQSALCNLCGHNILYMSECDYLVEKMLDRNLLALTYRVDYFIPVRWTSSSEPYVIYVGLRLENMI